MSSLKNGNSATQWPIVDSNDEIRDLYVSLEREFPQAAAEFTDGISRRRWLQLMGASLALTGAVGCRYQVEKAAPFVFRPKDRHPGAYVRYATTIDRDGTALPLLVNTIDGRPIKVDGNPDHPDSNGASDVFAQARILDLYDPDRSANPSKLSGASRSDATWAEFESALVKIGEGAASNQGGSLVVLSQPNSSPSVQRLKQRFSEKFPAAKWFEYSSVGNDNEFQGCQLAFGKPLRPQYALDKCRVIVSIDADFLSWGGPAVRANRLFAASRNPDKPDQDWMSRVYAVESQFSLVGASADHRLSLAPRQIASFVAAIETAVGSAGPHDPATADDPKDKFLAAMIEDLLKHKGESVVVCGWAQPPEVQAAVWRINQTLGNLGKTVTFIPAAERAPYASQLADLVKTLGDISPTLLILDGNPVFDAPPDLKFSEAIRKLPNTVYIGLTANDTSRECSWFANASHPLEAWGDGRSQDGSYCIAQPMIEPLYGSKSILEALSILIGDKQKGLDIVRETAFAALPQTNTEEAWAASVHMGFIADSAPAPVDVSIVGTQRLTPLEDWKSNWESGKLDLIFLPSRQLFDGRFANVGWLQELPDFVTKLTWDNAAIISPKTARAKNVKQGQMVAVECAGTRVDLPVHVQPGHANGTVTVAFGYGRKYVGRIGGHVEKGIPTVGADVGVFRTSDKLYSRSDAEIIPSQKVVHLALTQDSYTLDEVGREGIRTRIGGNSPLIRAGVFKDYRKFVAEHGLMLDESVLKTEHDADQPGQHEHSNGASSKSSDARKSLPVINASLRSQTGEHAQEHEQQPHAANAILEHGGDHGGHAEHDSHWPQGLAPHFPNESLTRGPKYSAVNKWGMTIDLSKCTGCNACVTACQAENNVPIVGKEHVIRGREMHWIRIDAYVVDDPKNDPFAENAEFKFQPVTCQHCENAPCETVCPVAATVHSNEGLNDMIYNRCIGTRYCGNNCPYKVRRFNYLNYTEAVTLIKYPNEGIYDEREKMIRGLGMNPEVTVRSRGVMEKCTYCVQRIQNVKIRARNEHRPIGPNEITTACQDACPTGTIAFGNLVDRASDVHKNARQVRAYQLLDQLGNLPRTRYLARVRNPHPALVKSSHNESHT